MSIRVVRDDAGLRALAPAWRALCRQVCASPYVSPDWLLPWWDQFGTAHARVAVRDDGGRLTGVLPLYLLPEEAKLLPMGVGLSDAFDAVVVPDAAPDTTARLLDAALTATPDALHCDLPEIADDAVLRRVRAVDGWKLEWRVGSVTPLLDLRTDVPSGQRRKLRMARHRADRRGGWTVARADAGTLDDMLDMLFRLHAARWADGGVLKDPRVAAFHRAAARAMLRDGVLDLRVLRIGGGDAGALLAHRSANALHLYISGFDEGFAYESPGTLLIGAMVDNARMDDLRWVDFLRGQEPYKYAWGAADRRNTTLAARRPDA